MIRLSSLEQVRIKVSIKITKFRVFNFRGTCFSKLSLVKISDNKVSVEGGGGDCWKFDRE